MNYLVTGGAGFIGSHLVDKLLELGHKVIVIDDLSLGTEENLSQNKDNENLIFHKKSICSDLDEIFKEKIDAVFHLAALPRVQFSIDNPKETHEANVNGTVNLLLTCKKFNVKRFVFSSSSSVYGDQDTLPLKETMTPNPMSPYALHKLISENYCKLFHNLFELETVNLRYFNAYGPRQSPEGGYACLIPKFMRLISENTPPVIYGDGEQTRDFAYISDIIDANILAATTSNKDCFGEVFNIGANNSISVNNVTKEIIKLSNIEMEPTYGPGVVEPKHTLADINKSKDLLNWSPKIPFQDGIKETFNSFKNIN